jgi:hypothetical protein
MTVDLSSIVGPGYPLPKRLGVDVERIARALKGASPPLSCGRFSRSREPPFSSLNSYDEKGMFAADSFPGHHLSVRRQSPKLDKQGKMAG